MDKNKVFFKTTALMISKLSLVVIVVIAVVLSLIAGEDAPWWLGTVCVLPGLIIPLFAYNIHKSKKASFAKEYFKKCKEESIASLDNDYYRQRALEIYEDYKKENKVITNISFEDAFYKGSGKDTDDNHTSTVNYSNDFTTDKSDFLQKYLKECNSQGVIALNDAIQQERAKIIYDVLREKYKMPVDMDYKAAFELAQKTNTGLKDDKALNEKLSIEKIEYNRLSSFANLYGCEKRKAMINEQIEIRRSARADSLQAAVALKQLGNVLTEPEHDSAMLGGIAAGIAGNAYGAATYVAYEKDNQRIRQSNARIKKDFSDTAVSAYSSAVTSAGNRGKQPVDEYEYLNELLNKACYSFISDEPADSVFKRLSLTESFIKISETGTCQVRITVSCNQDLYVMDKIPAVVDGTINAEIYDGEKLVGVAPMVLPLRGLEKTTRLKSLCLVCADPSRPEDYHVKYAAGKLFLIEKLS